ncbi:hypothetical protein SAY86_030544 [Trapa natans]|uniref:RNA-dependent RNA polymerase n=1 Tax=Trapa natans TaxID=22666 RepID=A0AAN7MSA5_TRANT|nr:hypothetical protein SAY86_030544 [Trapa natans]
MSRSKTRLMEPKGGEQDILVSQISIGGFNRNIRAKDLLEFLEEETGCQIDRCRLKTSWTPPDSFPDFSIMGTEDIQLMDDYKKVEPHAFIHFTSPDSASWATDCAKHGLLSLDGRSLKVRMGPESTSHMKQRRRDTPPLKLPNVIVDIGTLISDGEFWTAWRAPPSGVDFYVDPFDGTCKFCFTRDTVFTFKDKSTYAVIKCDFKMEFLVRNINEIKQYEDISHLVILLELDSSPLLYYRTADDDIHVSVPFDLLDDDDPWIRTTDFTPSGAIGRCNCYRISIPPRGGPKLMRVVNFLKERRIQEVCLRRILKSIGEPNFGIPLEDSFFSIGYKEGICFDVLYLLNAAVHRNIFNQHQLSESFFDLIRSQPREVILSALKHICSYKRPVFDAYKTVQLVQQWLLNNSKLLKASNQSNDIVAVRRLVITPSKAYCLPPEVELSNRVLRNYKTFEDRFLRVTFMDEGFQTLNAHVLNYYAAPILKDITRSSSNQKTTIFRRLKNVMTEGFYLCGRKYSFLAFSSNQLRDRSAWFFAEDPNINVTKILQWMGKFSINNVAKCAARMGQCFSSTYATLEVPLSQVKSNLPDIERNGYCFSDGIGTITPDLAREVAEKLKLENSCPSAYQIRYAGYKGVVACWPGRDDGVRLSLRKSMDKFISNHTILEICSWTRFQPGFLNRQIITLLSTLKVPDEIFWKMQQTMITKLDQMLLDANVAFDVLMCSCAEHENIAALMLSAGFRPQTEPHLRGMLTCIRAAQLWGLREKARIFVPEGRWLMGCFDEVGVLEHCQCFIQVSVPSLESCFVKHGSRFSKTKKNLQVVKGYVVVAKNPCLHPGDIRILEAVDVPELHHLYDCLIFPQNGERPHTNEASGSDLDGDLYFVTWDGDLIPPSRKSWPPMQYDPAEAKVNPRGVKHQDIVNFFVQHIMNENLGTICNAHVVHADRSEDGALNKNCLHLAELAATAVDFPKTGKLVRMPHDLKPNLYPDFMGKREYQSYKSEKILGRLYRQIIDVYDEDAVMSNVSTCKPEDIPYDLDLEVPGSENFISDAWEKKCSYDNQLGGLLLQYKVTREEEVVTGHVWSLPKYSGRKQGDLKERLKHSYTSLRKEFRQVFETMYEGFDVFSEEDRNKIFEQKASSWYQVSYHPKWMKKSLELREHGGCSTGTVMLSFAWIAADYLARIKIRAREIRHVDLEKPVNSLMGYLAERI